MFKLRHTLYTIGYIMKYLIWPTIYYNRKMIDRCKDLLEAGKIDYQYNPEKYYYVYENMFEEVYQQAMYEWLYGKCEKWL